MNKAKPQEEGILVMPDDIELREPRLKIPGKKPVGDVVVDWDKSMSRKLELALINTEKMAGPSSSSRIVTGIDLTGNHNVAAYGYSSYPPFRSVVSAQAGVGLDRSLSETNAFRLESSLFMSEGDPWTCVFYLDRRVIDNFEFLVDSAANSRWTTTFEDRYRLYNKAGELKHIFGMKPFVIGPQIWALSSGGGDTVYAYQDGNLFGSAAFTVNGTEWEFFTLGEYTGILLSVFIFNRKLSDAEHLSLARDPYQFLKPK